MAIFRVITMAALPFLAMPFVSSQNDLNAQPRLGRTMLIEAVTSDNQCYTVLYRTEHDFPDFMKKQFEIEETVPSALPNYNAVVHGSRQYLEV